MADMSEEDIEQKVKHYIAQIPDENKRLLDSNVDEDEDISTIAKQISNSWTNKLYLLKLERYEKDDIILKNSSSPVSQRLIYFFYL